MSKDIPLTGLKELQTFLTALPKNMQRNAISAGLRAGAKIIKDEAVLRVPKKTGALVKSIKVGSARKEQDGTFSIRVRVDPKAKGAWRAHFIEWGVRPHTIKSKAGKAMPIGDGKFNAGEIQHPGHRAQPFMRPALDVKAADATKALAASVRAYIEGKTGLKLPAGDED